MSDAVIKIIFMVLVGTGIGYATNVIAIRMLFRPYEPIRIPILGWKIWGLIPKRRAEIAKSTGETVQNELISMDEITARVLTEENKRQLIAALKERIMAVANEKIASIPFGLGAAMGSMVEEMIEVELTILIYDQADEVVANLTRDIEIGSMVEEKINQFDLSKLEEIILRVARTELRHIELLGGLLGAVIGLMQGVIVTFL